MMQSGAIQADFLDENGGVSKFLGKFEGRTGITKLNSTQVFNGMPPVKMQVKAIFRAWNDPVSEVEAPFSQLVSWALPVELAVSGPIGAVLDSIKEAIEGKPLDEAVAKAALPSVAPTKIAMVYKGRYYSPLVIESIGMPMDSGVDSNGNYVHMEVSMTLCTLTAIDRKDWARSSIPTMGYQGFTA
jgi:hypothetical protein